jgi:hypothetical protein
MPVGPSFHVDFSTPQRPSARAQELPGAHFGVSDSAERPYPNPATNNQQRFACAALRESSRFEPVEQADAKRAI